MKSVALFTLLASGCTFSIQLDGTDAAPADARIGAGDARPIDGGPVDAAPPIDAGPDAMPVWTMIETIAVPCSGMEVLSTTVLTASETYRLRAAGECVTNDSNDSHGDAEYAYNNFTNVSVSGGVDVGLAVNDTVVDGTKTPAWGAYQSSHNYSVMFLGLGARIVAKFHDPNYDNNSGQLTLYIDRFQ